MSNPETRGYTPPEAMSEIKPESISTDNTEKQAVPEAEMDGPTYEVKGDFATLLSTLEEAGARHIELLLNDPSEDTYNVLVKIQQSLRYAAEAFARAARTMGERLDEQKKGK